MALAVYSRVGSMLQAAGMDLEALSGLIATRYGLDVDGGALLALAEDGRVQWPNIEMLEAVALILHVSVDDLLDVRAMASPDATAVASDDAFLASAREARLRELTALRDRDERSLTEVEERDAETLIGEVRRALVERDIVAAAQHLNIPVEAARERVMVQVADAAHFWSELSADPEHMLAEVEAAKAQRRVRTG